MWTSATTAYEALEGADGVVILTEWNEFRALDLKRVKSLLKSPADGRSAQYLPARTDGGGRVSVCEHRPVSGRATTLAHSDFSYASENFAGTK